MLQQLPEGSTQPLRSSFWVLLKDYEPFHHPFQDEGRSQTPQPIRAPELYQLTSAVKAEINSSTP